MKKKCIQKICVSVVLLFLLILISHLIRYNWNWHARFNMLLAGFMSYNSSVIAADQNRELYLADTNNAIWYIYNSKSNYVGCVDGVGIFIPDYSDVPYEHLLRTDSIRLASFAFMSVVSICIVIGITLFLLIHVLKKHLLRKL